MSRNAALAPTDPGLGNASPSYPWRSYRVLRTHDFVEHTAADSHTLRIFLCRTCDRRFKFDKVTLETIAIGNDPTFRRLPDPEGSRWVTERCPGTARKGGAR